MDILGMKQQDPTLGVQCTIEKRPEKSAVQAAMGPIYAESA
jgi:hypothetical protein